MKPTLPFLILLTILTYNVVFGQLKVSCIGASVAAGYGIPASQNYPSQLQDILGSTFSIGNFGVSGATLMDEANFPYTSSSNYSGAQGFAPNIVTIELGSNDSKPYNWAYQDSFVSDYTQFINVFKSLASHPVIYICLPIPALTSNYDLNDSNITYGMIPLIKQIALTNNVKLIDLNTTLIGRTDLYQADGIHPNAAGALVLAQIIARAIAAPSYLTANVISVNQVALNWADNTNETGFTIERSTDSITWNTLPTVAANTTSYTDVGLSASTKYYYRMYASISVGNTNYSDVVSVVTTLANSMIPEITGVNTASAIMGTAFNYTVTATHTPTTYSATNLPAGLTINTSTGLISGVPVVAASTGTATVVVQLSATNANGTGYRSLMLTITPIAVPYSGTPASIPGKIEAENYDYGGEGIAYHDTDPGNTLGQYRVSEGVDIENCADTGEGYSIGQIQGGEWVQYTVTVLATGTYTLQLRVASVNSGEHLSLQLDGTDITGALAVPNTGGWQTWQTIGITTPTLTAGQKQLRIQMGSGGFNVNNIHFIPNVVLPVKLISLDAVAKDCNEIQLNWKTSDEINTASYQVESSNDGNNFIAVADIASKQKSNGAAYTYLFNSNPGAGYSFRLKMTDKDGAFTYSPVIAGINNNCSGNSSITIAPNPVRSILKINGLAGKTNFIIIYDVNGHAVKQLSSAGDGAVIDMGYLSAGNYLVKIMDGKGEVLKSTLISH